MVESKKKLRIPCSLTSFDELRERGCAYVDKTLTIEQLEALDSTYVFFVRPRRFGKSLFTTTLAAYYDRQAAGRFDELFAGTYIHEHKTPLAGQYYVLSLDFSGIGSSGDVAASIMSMVRSCARRFFVRYPFDGWQKIVEANYSAPGDLMEAILLFVAPFVDRKLYLIIDEYDQFANEILSKDKSQFKALTSSLGLLKDFYAKIKASTKDCLTRLFMTGVLPISLDSMTSGFSITTNYTTSPALANALGFTEPELRMLIDRTVDFERYGQTGDQIFDRMKELYNGYQFSSTSDESVFNSTMCLNYLRAIRDDNVEPEGQELFDSSSETDLEKIQGILALGDRAATECIVEDVLKGRPLRLPSPGLSRIINLNKDDRLDDKALLSTFFYMGFLTWVSGSKQALVCPNKMVREQFFRYYFASFSAFGEVNPDEEAMAEVSRQAAAGDLKPLLRYMEASLAAQVGIHGQLHASESSLQFYLLALSRSLRGYTVTAEEEALGKGVTDLLFKPVKLSEKTPSYLLELKRLAKSKATPTAVKAAVADAAVQLANYAKAGNVAGLPNLQKISVVFAGLNIAHIEVLS